MLKSRIPQITTKLNGVVQAAIRVGVEQVADDARRRAPVASGKLRDSIHVDGGYVIAGDEDVFYGHMVENGTATTAPHPFLVPALEANRGDIVATVSVALRHL